MGHLACLKPTYASPRRHITPTLLFYTTQHFITGDNAFSGSSAKVAPTINSTRMTSKFNFTNTHTSRQTHATHTHTNKLTEKHTNRKTYKQKNIPTYKQTNRQT